MSNAFQFEFVTKFYEGKPAIDNFSLTIPTGQTTVLIGPSGCGKSTAFGLLTGLVQPDIGTVFFSGDPILPPRFLRMRRQMGYVIQDGGLFPHLTGWGNAALLPQNVGWDREKISSRVAELAALVRLPIDLLQRYPDEMSGGQRQRVSLIRALMLNPSVLLLDEPFGALDPMVREGLQEDLSSIFHRLNKTVVLITHDLNEAYFFADLMVLMREGKIVQQGHPEDFDKCPADAFVSKFVKAQQRHVPSREPK